MEFTPIMRFAVMYLAFLMENDPNGFRDFVQTKSTSDLLPGYDFVIVGAGSAGCVVANRLSEIREWKILLLEAGGQENHYSRTPAVKKQLEKTQFDWNYTTTEQQRSCQARDGKCKYARGRGLGGSSAINAMSYTRGYRSDYDRWSYRNKSWSYEDVKHYFEKAEGNRIPTLTSLGTNGPLPVTYPPYSTKIKTALLQGWVELGLKNEDCAEYEDDCVEYTPTNTLGGRRWSASTSYLEPISRKRSNLDIVTGALVTKILFKNRNVASGVEFIKDDTFYTVKTKREVVLSAGSINSPKLLILSGIGPKDHLRSLDIGVIADLPVGNNLQDHVVVDLKYKVKKGSSDTVKSLEDGENVYLQNQTGPLSSTSAEVTSYVRVHTRHSERPLVQYRILTLSDDYSETVSIGAMVSRPKSRGTVRLKSSSYLDDPLIDVNYFNVYSDFEVMLEGLEKARELFNTDALKAYSPALVRSPQCADNNILKDYLKCFIEYNATTLYHPVGTVKMGLKSKKGVVNDKLQVYGVKNLRVIDASIPPYTVSMNTNAMAVMIGEKGADLIKEDYTSKMFQQTETYY